MEKGENIRFLLVSSFLQIDIGKQGRNHRKTLGATMLMAGRIFPSSWNRATVSENVDATATALVAPVNKVM